MHKTKLFAAFLTLLTLAGCASYRTNADIEFESANVVEIDPNFRIIEGDLKDAPYTPVGPVEAVVSKLTAFHKDPTKEQVNLVLFQQATLLGGNAVIHVKYKEGIGLWTWGYMQANGIAVKTRIDPSIEEGSEISGNTGKLKPTGIEDNVVTSVNSSQSDTSQYQQATPISDSTAIALIQTPGSNSISESKPLTVIDLSGTWRTTKSVYKIIQEGDQITGTYGPSLSVPTAKIWGNIEGDTVKLNYNETGGSTGFGKLKVNADGTELQGTWTSSNHKYNGPWDLERIE